MSNKLESKNFITWLISEVWDIFIESQCGYYINVEDKLKNLILYLRDQGISEKSMSCLEDISDESLMKLFDLFNEIDGGKENGMVRKRLSK